MLEQVTMEQIDNFGKDNLAMNILKEKSTARSFFELS